MNPEPDANASPQRGRQLPRIGLDLGPRVAAAVVMGGAALAVAWIGGIVFLVFWWIVSLLVLWEWERIVARERLIPRVAAGALVLAVAALLTLHNRALLAVVALAAAAAAVGYAGGPERRVWAGAGALYAGALVVSLGLLQASPAYGFPAILWLFAIVWGADVAAYFAGRAIGGPKLWPSVSPGKTWSGAVAGALAGAALGLGLSLILLPG
jgi:phosphatidate cytidylyltransferase